MEANLAAHVIHNETQGLTLGRVKAIHNENYQRNGTKSYVYLMNRFGFDPTMPGPYLHAHVSPGKPTITQRIRACLGRDRSEHVGRRLQKRLGQGDDAPLGEVTAEDQQLDSMYLIKVSIGTPPQTVLLDPDTGSADTWVMSPAQRKDTQSGHNLFDPKKSQTYKKLWGRKWNIQYGDGSTASGECGTDTLMVGGLIIENQVIETASKLSPQFSKGTGDGLIGLAWSPINTVTNHGMPDPQSTPVENMMKRKIVPRDSELFTSAFYSTRDKGKESFFTFGYIDQELLKSLGEDIHWTRVNSSRGFWSIPSETISVNGKKIITRGNKAIMDTGTTLALMSDETVDALYAQIDGARYDEDNQGYLIPGNITLAELPEFKIDIGNKQFLIQKEDLIFAPVEGGNWYGGVQSRGTLGFDIYGDTVLKSIYAIWDLGNKRFGAVPKIEETQNLELPDTPGGHGTKKFSKDLVEE